MKQTAKRQVFKDEYGEYCKVPLTQGCFAKVDVSDYEWLAAKRWCVGLRGSSVYARRTVLRPRREECMHRLILGVKKGAMVDHRNGDGLDNRRSNLRVATNRENQRNRIYNRGRSRFKGVAWLSTEKRWRARLYYNGRHIYLGYYRSEVVCGVDIGEIRAALDYDRGAKKYFGEFARPNILAG